MSGSARSVPDWVDALAARAKAADGAPPFSDQALVDYRLGTRELVAINRDVAALVAEPVEARGAEAEFVVDPDARGRGVGTRMLEQLLDRGVTLLWAHGDHPAARALAASHHLTASRELLHLVGQVPEKIPVPELVEGPPREGPSTSSGTGNFRVRRDEDEWVALNAVTFADHPEQGSVTRADLEQLETEPWFSADNFLVLREEQQGQGLRQDGRMIGYCWLKVENGVGEFYVVGVAPAHQGEHLGAVLFDAGLARLADLGIRNAHLYVEADNEPALRLYRARGFIQDSIDIQYSVRGLDTRAASPRATRPSRGG